MNILLVLYLIYLSWGTAGQGRVSLLEMSRYLRCSKTHMRNTALKLANDGLLEIIETFTDAGSKKLYLQLSDVGDDFLMQNFDAAIDTYHKHVAETVLLINERAKAATHAPRKLSKKELAQIAAGQKELF